MWKTWLAISGMIVVIGGCGEESTGPETMGKDLLKPISSEALICGEVGTTWAYSSLFSTNIETGPPNTIYDMSPFVAMVGFRMTDPDTIPYRWYGSSPETKPEGLALAYEIESPPPLGGDGNRYIVVSDTALLTGFMDGDHLLLHELLRYNLSIGDSAGSRTYDGLRAVYAGSEVLAVPGYEGIAYRFDFSESGRRKQFYFAPGIGLVRYVQWLANSSNDPPHPFNRDTIDLISFSKP